MEDVWTGAGLLRYVITGLAIATEYKVQVRAVRTAGGSWSTAVIGTTAWGAVWSFQSAFTDPGSDVEVTVAVGGVGRLRRGSGDTARRVQVRNVTR